MTDHSAATCSNRRKQQIKGDLLICFDLCSPISVHKAYFVCMAGGDHPAFVLLLSRRLSLQPQWTTTHFTICSISYVPMRSFFYTWSYNMKIHICLHSLFLLLLFVKHWEFPWHNAEPSMKTYQALKPCFMWSTPKMAILAERAVLGISNHFPSLEFWADSWHFWQWSLKNHSLKFVLQSSQKLSFFLLMQNLIFSAKYTFQQV